MLGPVVVVRGLPVFAWGFRFYICAAALTIEKPRLPAGQNLHRVCVCVFVRVYVCVYVCRCSRVCAAAPGKQNSYLSLV